MFPFYTLFFYYNLLTYVLKSLNYDRGFDLQEFMSHKPNKKKYSKTHHTNYEKNTSLIWSFFTRSINNLQRKKT